MKTLKNFVIGLMLCMYFVSTLTMNPAAKKISVSGLNAAERSILTKALNSALNNSQTFYTSRTSKELKDVIRICNKALANAKILENYKNELKTTIPELTKLLKKIIKHATRVLGEKKQKLKNELKKAQMCVSPVKPIKPKTITPPQSLPKKEDFIATENYKFYIMLDVQDFNTKSLRIGWDEIINEIESRVKDGLFIPDQYRHITLAWYESKTPLTQDFFKKIEQALFRANEILRIVYPHGIDKISLLDGAVLLGKQENVVAFRVAESSDLQRIQEIILKFISFEGIEGFKFSTFKEETPLHVTIGRIKSSRKGFDFKNAIRELHAPDGARASQDEGFSTYNFRSTHSSGDREIQKLNSYAF